MKVCNVSTYSPLSNGFGGIARSTGAYLEAFKLLGLEVDFVASTATLNGRVTPEELERKFPNVRARFYTPTFSKKWGIGFGFFRYLPFLMRSRYIFIHGTRTLPTSATAIIARLLRKKYYIIGHANLDASRVMRTRAKRKVLFALTDFAVLWSIRGARGLILSGEMEHRTLIPALKSLPFVLVENFFSFDKSMIKMRDLPPQRIYLCVGRIESDKGILSFCKAWKESSAASSKLVIAGSGRGDYFDRFIACISGDARISYEGEVSRDRVADLMINSSVVVLPTGLDDQVTENFGNVVVEAFMAGRPVMVTTGLHWDQYAGNAAVMRFQPNIDSAMQAVRDFDQVTASEYADMSQSAVELARIFHVDNALPKLRELIKA